MSSTADAALTLTVLGCDTPFPRPGRPCSGYLLQADDQNIWVDAGSGTLAELQRRVALAQVGTIWISHLHPDHWADLLAAWNAYANDDALPRPKVFGPPGWAKRLDAALDQNGASAKVFDVVELRDRMTTTVGSTVLTAFKVHHSVPTFGLRAEMGGRVLAYTADTGPCAALEDLARGSHLLVAESGAAKPQEFHCTPEDVAKVAGAAGAEVVVLTHLGPGLTEEQALARFRAVGTVEGTAAAAGQRIVA